MVKITKDKIYIIIKDFPTHIRISKNKLIKLNFNKVWAGLHHSTRNKIQSELTTFIMKELPNDLKLHDWVCETGLLFYVPRNYGNVKYIKGKLNWKKADPNKNYRWDIWSYSQLWLKIFDDCLVHKNIIVDDSIDYIKASGRGEFCEVADLSHRQLVFEIKKLKSK